MKSIDQNQNQNKLKNLDKEKDINNNNRYNNNNNNNNNNYNNYKNNNNNIYDNYENENEEFSENSFEENENENDYNKILEMKTFSEFKNYETENSIFIHIQNLHEKLNDKIMHIFLDFFIRNEKDKDKIMKFNSRLNGNKEDGIISYLFIREEFENILNDKEILLNKIMKKNSEIEIKLADYKTQYTKKDYEAKELKFKLSKKEVDLRFDYLNNLEKESKN